jgi:hypothetical protein
MGGVPFPVLDETEWEYGSDPHDMLFCVGAQWGPRPRKLRLFGCACCRTAWADLPEAGRAAVAAAEGYADGRVGGADLRRAHQAAVGAALQGGPWPWWRRLWEGEPWRSPLWGRRAGTAALVTHPDLGRMIPDVVGALWPPGGDRQRPADLLRELFGNPFRPVEINAAWRTADVVRLAEAAYEERALPAGTLGPDRLAVLADALEDAGCADADLLGHLRSPGPHVRGCWPVDLLLGKE